MWHTKNAFFREMQFWSHCYTVISYQALFRLPVYKISAVYLSGAKIVCFCTIRDIGSPTINFNKDTYFHKDYYLPVTDFQLLMTVQGVHLVLVNDLWNRAMITDHHCMIENKKLLKAT